MSNLNEDINSTITSAVNARVEAAVMEAVNSSDTMKNFVHAALNQKVTGNYGRDSKPLITHLVQSTIEEQAKQVVAEEIKNAESAIREEVRAALSKSIGVISDSLVDGFVASASGRYPSVRVEFNADR